MEMNELFYREPYRRACEAEVISCTEVRDGYAVVLSDTVFYPEGGGQPGDTGMLNQVRVRDTRRAKSGEILHLTEEPLAQGSRVHAEIDWERRFDLMQNHSGEHIVSGIVHRRFGYENVGFHMGDVIQVDFSGMLSDTDIAEIEKEANQIIWRNEDVDIFCPDSASLAELDYRSKKELSGTVRIVRIGDADTCACCGMHVAHTGEIGLIKILSCAKHGSGVRLEMLSGSRAFRLVQQIFASNQAISRLLCAKPLATFDAVSSLLDASHAHAAEAAGLRMKLLEQRWEKTPADLRLVLWFLEGMERKDLSRWADRLVHEKNAHCAALLNREKNGSFSYVILSANDFAKSFGKELNDLLSGRGGGRGGLLQGSFAADEETIRKTLEEKLQ